MAVSRIAAVVTFKLVVGRGGFGAIFIPFARDSVAKWTDLAGKGGGAKAFFKGS